MNIIKLTDEEVAVLYGLVNNSHMSFDDKPLMDFRNMDTFIEEEVLERLDRKTINISKITNNLFDKLGEL